MPNLEYDERLEPCVLTDKSETKTLPCRQCHRPCVVTQFASPDKTACVYCRKGLSAPELAAEQIAEAAQVPTPAEPQFDESLETEVLTDKDKTKEVPCRECKRRCVVTTFATAEKVRCNTCRGAGRQQHKERVLRDAAETVDPAKLENLADGLINPVFRVAPLCPFDPAHETELKSVVHTPNYGPRHLAGWDKQGRPKYDQKTGESVVYQCNVCKTTISYSTQHPLLMRQNEAPRRSDGSVSTLARVLGQRPEELEAVA